MVKKRQADLDIGTIKSGKLVATLRDQGKVKKKRNSKGHNEFASTAKGLLFGSNRERKRIQRQLAEIPDVKVVKGKKPRFTGSTIGGVVGTEITVRRSSRSPSKRHLTTNDIALPLNSENPGSKLMPLESDYALFNTEDTSFSNRRRTRSTSSAEELFTINTLTNRKSPHGKKSRQAVGNSRAVEDENDHSLQVDNSFSDADISTAAPRSNIQKTLQDMAHQTPLRYDADEMYVHTTLFDNTDQTQKNWKIGDHSWIVIFSHRIEIRGFVELLSLTLQGSIHVHGHCMSYGETVRINSPPGYHNGVLEHYPSAEQTSEVPSLEDLNDIIPDGQVSSTLYQEIEEYWSHQPHSALVYINECENPRLKPVMQLLPSVKVPERFAKLTSKLHISEYGTQTRYSQTTLSAVDHLIRTQSTGEPLRVVICGAKNLGKSTLIKYIVNRLLQSSESGVSHLDCDPGQCEFSPPGCLTLHTVTSPLLGPAWCNMPETVDNSELYGAISADVDPDRYVNCVKSLVHKYYNGETKHLPLLVNTMGWVQGLGLHFLAATIAEVKPTHVIQLCTEGESYHNFSEFSVFNLISHDMFLPEGGLVKLHEDLTYGLMPLTMPHNENLQYETDVLRPVLCRDLMTSSYMFSSSPSSTMTVNEIIPYRVNMSDIAMCLGTQSIPARLWSQAINMQIVVLCTTSPHNVITVEDNDYKIVSRLASLTVAGYGLVRAVDSHRKCLYITTPLSAAQLSTVNVVYKMHGSITPEMWLFQQIGRVDDSNGLPYLDSRKAGAGFVSTASAKYKYRKAKN